MKLLLDERVRVHSPVAPVWRVKIYEGRPPEFEPTDTLGDSDDRFLAPGFVDVHIHGAFGIDMMDADPVATADLADRLVAEGYDGFLPTTITAPFEQVRAAIQALPDHPAIWGFHLEGPFISPDYPGAQPPEFILDPPQGPSEWDWVFDHPKLKQITLAPERPGALDLIRRLSSRGVTVSMGHSNATFDQARRGFEAGARYATHTFNAMRPFHHREPGLVGLTLGSSQMTGELIYDRHHVSVGAAAVLARQGGFVAVSDASRAARLPDGPVSMWGHACTIRDGTVRLDANGALAGSTVLLSDVFKNLWDDFGARAAVAASCIRPRMRLDGRLNNPADWSGEHRLSAWRDFQQNFKTWLLVDQGRVLEKFSC